jgi:hypothetical protein
MRNLVRRLKRLEERHNRANREPIVIEAVDAHRPAETDTPREEDEASRRLRPLETTSIADFPVDDKKTRGAQVSRRVGVHTTLRMSHTTNTITRTVPSNPKPSISFLL